MTFVLYLLFALTGGAVGWGLHTFTAYGAAIAMGGGGLTFAILGQMHLLFSRKRGPEEVEQRVEAIEKAHKDTAERVDVLEVRADAIETTVKHELTERRDALVNEMKQLEGLIERLSKSFEAKLAETPRAPGAVASPDDAVLAEVKEALRENRVDLHLQPIVSLPQRRVAFYEGFTRLRRADGSLILPAQFLDAAHRARLLGVIDTMTMFRCVQIVRRLAEKDRRVGVFCNISAASLEDETIFPRFLEFMSRNRDLSGAMIFELRADRFETRSKTMRENMDRLSALGFRFSLDHSADLAMDLPRLQDAGVRFVKLGGQLLLNQLRDPSGTRPISSINRHLDGRDVSAVFSRYGVTLIAEKVEDEASVVEILDYDIPYGQGNVFGAARPIKTSLMEETTPPAELTRDLRANLG
ncbi:MAG: EAL domain-containing protein [Pseudomonadota bacterium]